MSTPPKDVEPGSKKKERKGSIVNKFAAAVSSEMRKRASERFMTAGKDFLSGMGTTLSEMSAGVRSFVDRVRANMAEFYDKYSGLKKQYEAAAGDEKLQNRIIQKGAEVAADALIAFGEEQANQAGKKFTKEDQVKVRESIRASVRLDGFKLEDLQAVVDETIKAGVRESIRVSSHPSDKHKQETTAGEEEDLVFGPNAKPFQQDMSASAPKLPTSSRPPLPKRPESVAPPLPKRPEKHTSTLHKVPETKKLDAGHTSVSSEVPKSLVKDERTRSMRIADMTGQSLEDVRAREKAKAPTLTGAKIGEDPKLKHVSGVKQKVDESSSGGNAMLAGLEKVKLKTKDKQAQLAAKKAAPNPGAGGLFAALSKALDERRAHLHDSDDEDHHRPRGNTFD